MTWKFLDMVVHIWNSSTWEVGAEDSDSEVNLLTSNGNGGQMENGQLFVMECDTVLSSRWS